MKTLQESLFDKDLVTRDIEIDFDTLKDMLFDFGRERKKLFDKAGVICHEGRQSIFIRRFIDDSQRIDAVCFELELGITNTYNNEKTLVPAFRSPALKAADEVSPGMAGYNYDHHWRYSSADINATSRLIGKKINFEKATAYNYTNTIIATESNLGRMIVLYDKMVKYFCSDEFKKILQKYVKDSEYRQLISGVAMDILMKKLIDKAI